ncbi:MAG TPA: hypothetical protein PKC49_05750 [Phycisphaerae bacterium]|nr:hypothetical protein [Phycisphaerae bacterium]
MRCLWRRHGIAAVLGFGGAAALGGGGNPWADEVISYVPGSNPSFGFTNPLTVLGSPERFTGEEDFGGEYASAVTPFNTAFGSDEILSIGAGGHVIVRFDEPITNDPSHLYGVDLIVFGNGSFVDGDYPNGVVAGLFSEGPFTVSVSADGVTFFDVASGFGDGVWPAQGYLDLDTPYSDMPGNVPSDFLKPLNPALTFPDFLGKDYSEVKAIYDGSGGGLPIDIAPSGLAAAYYVRIDVATDVQNAPEIDAFAVVPEPACGASLALFGLSIALRRNAGKSGRQPGGGPARRPLAARRSVVADTR